MVIKNLCFTVLAALFVSGALFAGEEPSAITQPPRGTFKMLPELVGKHPRLYFTKKDIPELTRNATDPNKWFIDRLKQNFGGRYSSGPGAKVQDWERYLYGFWGLAGADMLYVTNQGTQYRDIAKRWVRWNLDQNDWTKDDLVPMDILSGLSITYDILYDDFTEAERKELRQRIFDVMKFIHGRFFVGQYWTGDYQNNHMHNRIHGLANASFAIYGDDPNLDVQPYADMAVAQWRNVVKWLPEDGSTHEGPGYWSYGHHWLVRTAHLMEHVTGEKAEDINPFFTNSHMFRIYMTCPGWKNTFGIGDAGDGPPGNLTTVCRPVAEAKDPYGQAWIQEMMKINPGEFYQHPAWGLMWYDASLKPKPIDELPLWRFWPDLEMFSIRSSWKDDAVALVFKCGPVGGHKLQKLRGNNWANVAHDHPDQNHFLLYAFGKMLAEDDDYPKDKKLTRSHNTITVDGKGQPREGEGWQQPFPYDQCGTMKDVFLSGSSAYSAGDASRLYTGADKFIRHIAFVEGQYVLIFDDLAGSGGKEHEFDWRLHKKGDWKKIAPDHFSVADGDISLDIQFLAPKADLLESAFLPAELTAKPCLSVKQKARNTCFLTLLVPQQKANPQITASVLENTKCIAVQTIGPDFKYLVMFAQSPGIYKFGKVETAAVSAIVRFDKKDEVLSALMTRGTALSVSGVTLISASKESNISWRRQKDGIIVDAESSYKSTGTKTTVQVGGLAPNTTCRYSIDDKQDGTVKTDGRGLARIELDLYARRSVRLGGNVRTISSLVKISPENAASGDTPPPEEEPSGPTPEEIAAAQKAEIQLRKIIIDGVAGGKKEPVSINIGHQPVRGILSDATDKDITVKVQAMEMKTPWADLAPEYFYRIAVKYSDDRELLNTYCRGMGLPVESVSQR